MSAAKAPNVPTFSCAVNWFDSIEISGSVVSNASSKVCKPRVVVVPNLAKSEHRSAATGSYLSIQYIVAHCVDYSRLKKSHAKPRRRKRKTELNRR